MKPLTPGVTVALTVLALLAFVLFFQWREATQDAKAAQRRLDQACAAVQQLAPMFFSPLDFSTMHIGSNPQRARLQTACSKE